MCSFYLLQQFCMQVADIQSMNETLSATLNDEIEQPPRRWLLASALHNRRSDTVSINHRVAAWLASYFDKVIVSCLAFAR
jgi:hypothetical protein